MLKELMKEDFLIRIGSSDKLEKGTHVIHQRGDVVQLGRFDSYTCDGMVLEDVINLTTADYLAERGLIRTESEDRAWRVDSQWDGSSESNEALSVIRNWSLFAKYPALQKSLLRFVSAAFPPAIINFLAATQSLRAIFVPLQQRFRVGRFSPVAKWDEINITRFCDRLQNLTTNEYITYMGYLPNGNCDQPLFYSLGTETHLETDLKLKKEPVVHAANCGGNIMLLKEENGSRTFLVDAGSSYKGKGVKASVDEAKDIARHLKKIFPAWRFIPVEGRGAIGHRYSF